MPPPLFTIESKASKQENVKVNLLPCRIHHDGDVKPSNTFWNPTETREGYYGVVVEKEDAKPQTSTKQGPTDEDIEIIEDSEDQLEVGAMRGKAAFDELTVWGHDSTGDSSADPYVRGMEEWIAFSEEV
ncbi:hypothetical protein E0Z10_g2015 [Xylaria hypoxylon]|uniref:Uncharacterized protein n=1 Tax=Xylaria hypoxylon TaxID=37992 RepID=A0A4Z0Z5M6_9PEZI|nr:hypothetical protein E0Z10_g2015 [Xylaria hypoxylon]